MRRLADILRHLIVEDLANGEQDESRNEQTDRSPLTKDAEYDENHDEQIYDHGYGRPKSGKHEERYILLRYRRSGGSECFSPPKRSVERDEGSCDEEGAYETPKWNKTADGPILDPL